MLLNRCEILMGKSGLIGRVWIVLAPVCELSFDIVGCVDDCQSLMVWTGIRRL
jgi:hypothetical protein